MDSEPRVLFHWRVQTSDGAIRVWAKDEPDAEERTRRRGLTPLGVMVERRHARRTDSEWPGSRKGGGVQD